MTEEKKEEAKSTLDALLENGKKSVSNLKNLLATIEKELEQKNLESYQLWQLSTFSQSWERVTIALVDLQNAHLTMNKKIGTAKEAEKKG